MMCWLDLVTLHDFESLHPIVNTVSVKGPRAMHHNVQVGGHPDGKVLHSPLQSFKNVTSLIVSVQAI